MCDALLRTLAGTEIAVIRALLMHAISPEAKRFYKHFVFRECPGRLMTLVLSLRDAQAMLQRRRKLSSSSFSKKWNQGTINE